MGVMLLRCLPEKNVKCATSPRELEVLGISWDGLDGENPWETGEEKYWKTVRRKVVADLKRFEDPLMLLATVEPVFCSLGMTVHLR